MADSVTAPASYGTQANALLRKNLTFQKRNVKTNIRLILVPIFLVLLIRAMEITSGIYMNKKEFKCGCKCVDKNGTGKCEDVCGLEYSNPMQAETCEVKEPRQFRPLFQIPEPKYSAVKTDFITYPDLPNESCRKSESCPAIILVTANQKYNEPGLEDSNLIYATTTPAERTNFLDPAFVSDNPAIFSLRNQCRADFMNDEKIDGLNIAVKCRESLILWRNNSSEINEELYKGYTKGNVEKKGNEIAAAYDFLNTEENRFNVSIWYNATYKASDTKGGRLTRVPPMVNMVSNEFLQSFVGSSVSVLFEFVKEMPKHGSMKSADISHAAGPIFFSWVILQLFPVAFVALVYEKQQNLRIMMKMHGLKDGPYWTITYAYFLIISSLYMFAFVAFGSFINLSFFHRNAYSIQFVFYFTYINLQIAWAFLLAGFFSDVKTATVMGYMVVFASGLLGSFFFSGFLSDSSISEVWIILMELYPGFSLYRGLFEFGEYSNYGAFTGEKAGMKWENLNDPGNGIKEAIIIMLVEWVVVLLVAFYLDQINSSGKSPLFFLANSQKKQTVSTMNLLEKKDSGVCLEMEKEDVSQERERAEQMAKSTAGYPIVVDNLKKVYPGIDGNPDKYAVRGLSLAVPEGECLGMLGPNGAGKTSFISMMIGLTKPSSGAAFVDGLNINTEMGKVYTIMGVCPQHDLLWDTLTGREHLLFYGRLKNLKGKVLHQAVEDSLKSLNLFNGGVADKQAGRYSGGMKRRLSVAISLIGNPRVVYLDEPSTGLDPASRDTLWTVVKNARKGRAIILTTHSMEEADYLCDRLGIFVDGSLQCIGNSTELKARYGGSYVLAVTTSSDNEVEVENMVKRLCPNANKAYHLSGTQKFELPKHEAKIADVFKLVEDAKSRFPIYAWGMADTTLEDVFIKVASSAQSFNEA